MNPIQKILGKKIVVDLNSLNNKKKCRICGTPYNPDNLTLNAIHEDRKFGKGKANMSFELPCGHFLLDDKTNNAPRYVESV